MPDDAVPLWELTGEGPRGRAPGLVHAGADAAARALAGGDGRGADGTVALIIASFLTINAAGLCNTYGQLHF